jgi:glyoxylase-like metal-dependent hydrolase (beta-lactamase superfamily II)
VHVSVFSHVSKAGWTAPLDSSLDSDNTLVIAFGALVLYLIAYNTYGRWLGKKIFKLDGKNVTPDRYLEDGDELDLAGNKFGVAHCPGHTPGHVVIYNQEGAMAFVGDVLFRGSVGRTDFPRGNHQQLIDSITGKLWPLGDEMRFVPGHGPMSTFGQERIDNPFVADAVTGYAGAEKGEVDLISQRLSKRWT